jgi:hypothetical protein
MNEKTKATLTNVETWKRGLFMVVFAIISGVAKLIVTLVAIFQFVTLLFKGQINAAMLPLGQNLSTYLYQITLFLTFKTDEMPFPFNDFPDAAPESKANEVNIDMPETYTKTDEETVAVTDEDIKDEKNEKGTEQNTGKDTKHDTSNG